MTSSNVSNLLVQVNLVDNSPKTKPVDVKNNDNLFVKTLQDVSEITPKSDLKAVSEKPEANQDTKTVKLEDRGKRPEVKQEEKAEPDKAEIAEKVEEIVTEVKEVIEDELDVTEEDIQLAMETLGLTVIDLFEPQNLAQVVAEVSEETESISLIMSEDFAEILDKVGKLSEQLFKETGSTPVEIKEIMVEMDTTIEPLPEFEIPDVETVQPEQVVEPEKTEVIQPIVQEVVVQEVQAEVKPAPEEKAEPKEESEPAIVEEDSIAKEIIKPSTTDTEDNNESFDSKEFKKESQPNLKTESKPSNEPIIRHDHMVPTEPKFDIQFSVEEQVVELPTGETVKASEIVNQFIEQARVLTTTESTTMEMTLNPEGLGKIFLEVTQKGNEITAKIFTENDAVKQALESQMANLRTDMNQSATKVTSIEVAVGTHEFERNLDENTRDDSRREEQSSQQSSRRRGRIDINSLDDLSGLMTDEEMLIAQMMRDNGGTLDFMA